VFVLLIKEDKQFNLFLLLVQLKMNLKEEIKLGVIIKNLNYLILEMPYLGLQ
jgi:hypothetical protein